MRIVLATRNQGKVRELQAMLEGKGIEVLGLESFPQIGEKRNWSRFAVLTMVAYSSLGTSRPPVA